MCSPECCGLRSSALSQNRPLSDGPGRPDAHRLPCTYTKTHIGRVIMDESTLKLSGGDYRKEALCDQMRVLKNKVGSFILFSAEMISPTTRTQMID